MGNLIKGLKVAAYVAEIIVAGSVVIELAEKYLSKPQHYPKNTVFYSVNHSVIG